MREFPDGLIAQLVTDPDAIPAFTLVRTVDCRTALARGLAEYLAAASITFAGRTMSFAGSVIQWGLALEPAHLPSVCVVGSQDMQITDPNFAPIVHHLGDGVCLKQTDHVTQVFDVMVWTTDPVERMGLVAAVEDLQSPVDWMAGFRLKLPYYFDVEAVYAFGASRHDDSEESAKSSRYVATFSVSVESVKLAPMLTQPLVTPTVKVTMDGIDQF